MQRVERTKMIFLRTKSACSATLEHTHMLLGIALPDKGDGELTGEGLAAAWPGAELVTGVAVLGAERHCQYHSFWR